MLRLLWALFWGVGGGLLLPLPVTAQTGSEWQVVEGYRVVEDAGDVTTAVGIAFIPNSGKNPDDIRYLVAELRGRIVGVTNAGKTVPLEIDTTIHQPARELPHFDGETGQTGLCMTPDGKQLFSTGVETSGWARINKITRWESVGPRPWAKIRKVEELTEPFKDDPAGNAHQIGHCFIGKEGKLWVGTGDGHNHTTSHDPKHSNGKLLRMNLDFTGVKDNPFYNPAAPQSPESLVYAMGFRNPFAVVQTPGGAIYVADNGPSVDRLLEVEKGKNYPWDNTDESMTYNNLMTFRKAIGPADMIYIPEDDQEYPAYRGHLIIAASHMASLVAIPVRPGVGVLGNSKWLVEPTNKEKRQDFTALERGPDGLYISHIRMNTNGGILPSTMLKFVASSNAPAVTQSSGDQLFEASGCRGCHVLAGTGSNQGPALDGLVGRLYDRLSDQSYLNKLQALVDGPDHPDKAKMDPVRLKLVRKEGTSAERVKLWISAQLRHPTFDNLESPMPKLNLEEPVIEELTSYLIATTDPVKMYGGMPKWLFELKFKAQQNPRIPLALTLLLGIFLGVFFRKLVYWGSRIFSLLTGKKPTPKGGELKRPAQT